MRRVAERRGAAANRCKAYFLMKINFLVAFGLWFGVTRFVQRGRGRSGAAHPRIEKRIPFQLHVELV